MFLISLLFFNMLEPVERPFTVVGPHHYSGGILVLHASTRAGSPSSPGTQYFDGGALRHVHSGKYDLAYYVQL